MNMLGEIGFEFPHFDCKIKIKFGKTCKQWFKLDNCPTYCKNNTTSYIINSIYVNFAEFVCVITTLLHEQLYNLQDKFKETDPLDFTRAKVSIYKLWFKKSVIKLLQISFTSKQSSFPE